jgi:hypothetical protein
MAGVMSSIASWWPVAVSWLLVKDPGETTASFRWWQILFALINIAAVVGYLGSVPSTLGWAHEYYWALLHGGLLVVIAPLAIESQSPPDGHAVGASPDTSPERTRER